MRGIKWHDGKLEIGDAVYSEFGLSLSGIYRMESTHIGVSIMGFNLLSFEHQPDVPYVAVGILGFTWYIAGSYGEQP